jgi:hypothetical protein
MRRSQLDVKRVEAVGRLKSSLSGEHPIAGDELRAIERYLAPSLRRPPASLLLCVRLARRPSQLWRFQTRVS